MAQKGDFSVQEGEEKGHTLPLHRAATAAGPASPSSGSSYATESYLRRRRLGSTGSTRRCHGGQRGTIRVSCMSRAGQGASFDISLCKVQTTHRDGDSGTADRRIVGRQSGPVEYHPRELPGRSDRRREGPSCLAPALRRGRSVYWHQKVGSCQSVSP